MSVVKPYHRNYRAFKNVKNWEYSEWAYIIDREYSIEPSHFVRPFLMIQNDLLKLFEYVEPSEESLNTFSFRIHELLMRTCIEIEANFKAILEENIYTPSINKFGNPIYNMTVYRKIDHTHHLSSYEVLLPTWRGGEKCCRPFSCWAIDKKSSPDWYQAYNSSKHDRQNNFKHANLDSLIGAVAGLLVLLSSQFKTQNFSSGPTNLILEGDDYHRFDFAIGDYFRIKFPQDWKEEEKYDFDWGKLKNDGDRFQKINYNEI